MDAETLGFALVAGMVATVNPCGFAMLPAYLALVVAGEGGQYARGTAILRAMAATGAMALGFLAVFGAFGLVISPLASSVQQYLPVVTVVIGLGMVVLGGWMLAGREITLLLPKPGRGAPTARLGSMTGYGVAYALVSLSCTFGPFLAVTSATFRNGSLLGGIVAYLTYAVGMALVVGVLAVAVATASSAVTGGLRAVLPYVNRIGGGLVVLVGLYVGYYGVYELRLFHGGGSAEDAVVDGAALVQTTVADFLDAAGPLPLVVVMLSLAGLGILLGRRGAANRRET